MAASVLSTATRLHYAALAQAGGVVVAYRLNGGSVAMTLVPGQSLVDEYGDDGTAITARVRDWLGPVDQFIFEGEPFLPARGHEIDWVDYYGVKHTYAVAPGGEGRCYRFTNANEVQLRIHSVKKRATLDS
jgi:hypothetical protein